jgi:hypothetical protein
MISKQQAEQISNVVMSDLIAEREKARNDKALRQIPWRFRLSELDQFSPNIQLLIVTQARQSLFRNWRFLVPYFAWILIAGLIWFQWMRETLQPYSIIVGMLIAALPPLTIGTLITRRKIRQLITEYLSSDVKGIDENR